MDPKPSPGAAPGSLLFFFLFVGHLSLEPANGTMLWLECVDSCYGPSMHFYFLLSGFEKLLLGFMRFFLDFSENCPISRSFIQQLSLPLPGISTRMGREMLRQYKPVSTPL